MAEGAKHKPNRHDGKRRKAFYKARKNGDQRDRQDGRADGHQGERGGRPRSQEGGIAEGLRSNLMREHETRGHHGHTCERPVQRRTPLRRVSLLLAQSIPEGADMRSHIMFMSFVALLTSSNGLLAQNGAPSSPAQ